MATIRLGIIMHGITGRMGYNQHLVRSIVAIRDQGGVLLANGDRVMPDPILIGRNADKINEIAKRHGITRTGTDLAAALRRFNAWRRGNENPQLDPAEIGRLLDLAAERLESPKPRQKQRRSGQPSVN